MNGNGCSRVAVAASVLTVMLGLGVLIGYVLDLTLLKSLLPVLVTLKVSTGVSFVVCGVSLGLQCEPTSARTLKIVARACALLSITLGVLTLLDHLLGKNLGIDQWLLGTPAALAGTPNPGRMTLATAASFTAMGATLALLDERKPALQTTTQVLALAVLVAALARVPSYLSTSAPLYGFDTYGAMAIHSAVGFVVLSIGVLAVRPRVTLLRIRDWPLPVKMAALLSVASVAPLMIAAFVDTRGAAKHLEQTTAALLAARSDQLVGELDGFNLRHLLSVELLARAAATIGCCDDLDAAKTRAVQAILATRPASDSDVRGAAILDMQGRVRLATQARMVGLELFGYAHIRAALRGRSIISDVHDAEIDPGERPTVAYLAPGRRPDGTIDGVAVIWVRASALWHLMRMANGLAGPRSFAVLFDQQGIRIAHTYSDEIIFHPGGPLTQELIDHAVAERRFGERTKALLQDVRAFPEQFERARADTPDPGIFRGMAPINRQWNYGVARRLKTVHWTVFYMAPEATLLAQIAESTRGKTLFAGVAIVLALIAGTLFAAMIVGPLRALSLATERLALGEPNARLVNPGSDELGRLGRSFNDMADRIEAQSAALRRSNEELEERVRQRTADLTESEQGLSITLDSIGDAVIATDCAGRVGRMNRVAEDLTGWTLAEARAKPLDEIFRIIHEQTLATVQSPVERVLRERTIVGMANHTLLVARDGSQHSIADSAAPIVDADGSMRGVVLVFRDVWVERAAAEALRVSEARYRELYESHPDMCATVDILSEIILDCNATFARQLGYAKDDIVGHPVSNFYHVETLDTLAEARELFRRALEFKDDERVLKRKDGSRLESSLSATSSQTPDGRLQGKAVWRDISVRKQEERDRGFMAELGDAQRLCVAPLELMGMVTERLARYLSAARATFIEVDVERDRITIQHDCHPGLPAISTDLELSTFAAENRADQRAGRTSVTNDIRSDARTASSFERAYEPLQVHASVTVPLIRNGQWIASLSVTETKPRVWERREVTLIEAVAERASLAVEQLRLTAVLREKELQELARRSEQRFRTLVEGVKDYAILLLDPKGYVMSWSGGAERIKGYAQSEIIGKHFSVFYSQEDIVACHPAEVLRRAESEGRHAEEGWRVRKDGSKLWADVLVTALRDGNGVLEGFAKVTRDHSERRQADEALRQRQEQLSASLKEREVLLQEVHHRVKNNLQVISSLINMQMRQMVDVSAKIALAECKTRIEAIALIHEKLYQYQDYANVPFSDYARSLSANIFHATGISPGSIELQVEIEPVSLAVDKAIPCGLILNELITNTLKHAFPDERSGKVRVELRAVDEQRTLLLIVQDDGVGMPAAFDITKSVSLGMRLVTTLVEQLDGTLEIVCDAGTLFRVQFPIEAKP
jgi:PAS domain S-box-containing protein